MNQARPLTVTRTQLLHEGSDARFRSFLHAFMVFSRRVEAIRERLAAAVGVTPPQYEILSHLREHLTDGLAIKEIAGRLHCAGAFATAEINKLAATALVSKTRDPIDARRVIAKVTALCEKRFRDNAKLQCKLNDTLFASVTARQFAVLCETFPELTLDGDRAVALAGVLSTEVSGSVAQFPHDRVRVRRRQAS